MVSGLPTAAEMRTEKAWMAMTNCVCRRKNPHIRSSGYGSQKRRKTATITGLQTRGSGRFAILPIPALSSAWRTGNVIKG